MKPKLFLILATNFVVLIICRKMKGVVHSKGYLANCLRRNPIREGFPLPCTIGNFNILALADLGASVKMMSYSLFKKLNLTNLRETTVSVEMKDMSRIKPKGTVGNVLLKIGKFLFPGDFLIIDMIEGKNNNIILRRLFLATSHANIKVFEKLITLGIGDDRITFNHDGSLKSLGTSFEEVCMIRGSKEVKTDENDANLFSCDLRLCLKNGDKHKSDHIRIEQVIFDRWNDIFIEGRTATLNSHHCDPVIVDKGGSVQAWPSCNSFKDYCDGGKLGKLNKDKRIQVEWTCFHGGERRDIEFRNLSFYDWYRIGMEMQS